MSLIKRAKESDASALIELFDSTVHNTYYICSSMMPNKALATETLISTYKRVFSSIDNMEDKVDFGEWMKNAAAVTCCTELRRSNRNIFLEDEEFFDSFVPQTERNATLNMEKTAAVVNHRIETIPVAQRCALILYYFNSLLPSQIARVMCLPGERVKELLLSGRDKLAEMQQKLEVMMVETCSMAMLPIMEFCAMNQDLPEEIDAYSVLGIEKEEEIIEEQPKKKFFLKKSFLLLSLIALCIICSGAIAIFSNSSPKDKTSSNDSSSAVSQTADSSEDISSQEENIQSISLPVCNYDFSKVVYYNENDEIEKTVQYKYDKKRRLASLSTKTELFEDICNYSYSDGGKTIIVTDGEGNVIEKSTYDNKGNIIKSVFPKDNVVNYKWDYKLDSNGLVLKETFKSENNGSRTYTRDAQGRVLSVVNMLNGNSIKTEYAYDQNEMVIKKIETDSEGNQKIFNYTYDYDALQFHAKVSNGEYFYGSLIHFAE